MEVTAATITFDVDYDTCTHDGIILNEVSMQGSTVNLLELLSDDILDQIVDEIEKNISINRAFTDEKEEYLAEVKRDLQDGY